MESGLLTACERLSLTGPDQATLYGSLLLYAFGGCRHGFLKKAYLSVESDLPFPEWKRTVGRNGALYKNSKMYLYAYVCGSSPSPKTFGISIKEANALKKSLVFQPLSKHLNRLKLKGYRSLGSTQEADRIYASVLSSRDLAVHTKKFCYKKLSFLASYGLSLSELPSQLIHSSYFSLLKQYPAFSDPDHLHKLAKVAVHNSGINLIYEMTRAKRQTLSTAEDGTVSSMMSPLMDSSLSINTDDHDFISKSYLVTGIDGEVHSNWESLFSLRQLATSNKLNHRQKRLLNLLLGSPDAEFQEFLGVSQQDALELDYQKYLIKVSQFLGSTESLVNAFLKSLRPLL